MPGCRIPLDAKYRALFGEAQASDDFCRTGWIFKFVRHHKLTLVSLVHWLTLKIRVRLCI